MLTNLFNGTTTISINVEKKMIYKSTHGIRQYRKVKNKMQQAVKNNGIYKLTMNKIGTNDPLEQYSVCSV